MSEFVEEDKILKLIATVSSCKNLEHLKSCWKFYNEVEKRKDKPKYLKLFKYSLLIKEKSFLKI